jgi:hypothetical protein
MPQVELGDNSSSGARVGDGEENWLADVGEVDWVEDPSGQRLPYRPSGEHRHESAAPDDEERALIQRRRAIAALVALVVVGLAIAIPVIAFGGGGGGSPVVSDTQTTNATPPPATTTPASTKPPTTHPSTTTQTFKLPAGETLKLGSTGSTVTELQHALTTLGYDPGKADGSFGPTTQAAVQKFQTDKGLPADGVVGPKTATAINEALAAKSTAG